jgi:signal transduction histidine kinase
MFHSARLKLTAWYLVIIMAISLTFSVVIYTGVTADLRRRFADIERCFRQDQCAGRMSPNADMSLMDLRGNLRGAQARVLTILIFANGAILVLSAGAGWLLAGQTLHPIEESLEEQKRFTADASHELRTPLTSLKASIEVALRDQALSPDAAKEVLQSCLEDIDSLEALTADLLRLARDQGSNGRLNFEEIDIKETVEKAARTVAAVAETKNVQLELDAAAVTLEADRQSLEKLAVILLENAVKYTPTGGRVSVTTSADRGQAILTVRDTGIGIAAEDLPHIFDRFYRVDQSRSKTQTPGFGLGLSIAKKIVDEHGGTVSVDSAVDRGTTVTVALPAKRF